MRDPKKALIASLASMSLLLTACGGAGSEVEAVNPEDVAASDIEPTSRDEIKDGGTLTTAVVEVPEQQNTFNADASQYTRYLWNWYNPVTVVSDGEGNYEPNPDYLTGYSAEEVDGNTVVTFDINEKATFNDGTPIDWTAFETTWIINNGKSEDYNPNSTDGYELITSVARGDSDKQAIVTFDGAYPWWEGLFMLLAHPALKEKKNYDSYLNEVHPEWGAGPFTVEKVDFNKGEASFVPNDKWWGDAPKLDKRVFRQMEDQAELNAFRNGELDAASAGNKDRYAAVSDMDGIDIRMATRTANSLLTLNAEAPNLADIKVRQAIATAIDRNQIGEIVFDGVPYTETPPGSFTLFGFQEGAEDNYSTAVEKFDPEAAKALLDEAGWTLAEGETIRTKDGEPLKVRYTVIGEDPVSNAMSIAVQSMLKNIGVDVVIENHPSSDFSKVFTSGDFDIFPMGFMSNDPFGVAYFGQMYASDSQLNLSHTGTPEFDKKIEELQKLPTAEEQIKRANELEDEAFQHYGLIPTFNGASIIAVKEDLVNYGAPGFSIVPLEDIGYKK
ncbi:ABC transporter family substrate-binding protein [Corynebacterium uterequi]|uniref:ABC-type dipeptide transport system, periplasmic component n=1 Tax=Corynebacterium uterequi TaxID=1072256 RepID=A0A0G3H9R8_9CORY|nr:ABC transporter family substrate-binding protein [Corynebacterium uterequi]AKK10079.1 ABC-type dipeptide transport system, periplasmic component [Corynebacterium uterequi]